MVECSLRDELIPRDSDMKEIKLSSTGVPLYFFLRLTVPQRITKFTISLTFLLDPL